MSNHHWYGIFQLHWVIISLVAVFLYRRYIVTSSLYSVTNGQVVYFYMAVGLFILLKATPLDLIGTDYLFSAHTLQLSLVYFVVVPLILLSLPVTFLRQYIWHHQTRFALNTLAHPWLTLIAFNGLIVIYYIPTVFNLVDRKSVV